MKEAYKLRISLAKWACVLGVSAIGSLISARAIAGCASYGYGSPLTPPANWSERSESGTGLMPAVFRPGAARLMSVNFDGDAREEGIVGLWRFTFVSDGSAHPQPIPAGTVLDFGTQQWHSDGTEFIISGGRPPSSGDVCMGVWKKVGKNTYKMRHVALAWVSSDSPGQAVSPAVFLGPAIMKMTVRLNAASDAFEGVFTIDQFAVDETTLLEHIGGTVKATRFTVD